jgi:energy-coupling factor transporter ATP-binding protein EcfA2
MEPKLLKLAVCTGFALSGWLLPASMPLPKPIQGLSLGLAFVAALEGVSESKKQAIRSRFSSAERTQEFEYLAHELTLKHERRINDLYQALGFGHDEDIDEDGDREESTPPQLPGATIHQQTQLNGTPNLTWEFIEPSLVSYPAVALIGPQGSGKTTIAQHLIRIKKAAGHEVIVLDPHYRRGEWQGCKVIGAGKDYRAIDAYLAEVASTVEARYREREKHGTEDFKPITIVVEELTCWAGKVENAQEFIKSSMSDFRKIGLTALFISHGETNSLWGDAKGTRGLRDSSLAFIRPQVRLTPQGARPAGKASIAVPGYGSGIIDLPDLRQSPTPSPTPSPAVATPTTTEQESDRERLTRSFNLKPSISPQHTKIVDFVLSQVDCTASTRQVQRACGIGTADQVKSLFSELQALELGEVIAEGDRVLFKAYV